MDNSFRWSGRVGIQVIGGKEIQHANMFSNLAVDRENVRLAREARGIVAGRVEAPLMSYNKNTQEVTWARHRSKSGGRRGKTETVVVDAKGKGKKK